MKHATPESMKFKKLQRRLGTSRVVTAGTLELLWITTQKNAKRGDIGRFSNEEIAIECDWDGDPDELVRALVDTGWLDESSEHRLVVHDWHDHCPAYLKAAVARAGGFATVDSEAPAHLPQTAEPAMQPAKPLPAAVQPEPLTQLEPPPPVDQPALAEPPAAAEAQQQHAPASPAEASEAPQQPQSADRVEPIAPAPSPAAADDVPLESTAIDRGSRVPDPVSRPPLKDPPVPNLTEPNVTQPNPT